MQTSALMMWRHLRRALLHDLFQPGSSGNRQIEYLTSNAVANLDRIENRNLVLVLEHLASKTRQRDARAWLIGDRLPDAVLESLGIAPNDSEEESLEDESRRIVRDIAALLKPIPLVLCLDQLEALQTYPGDKMGLFAIGNLMAALHDEAPNIVVVGCVQSGLLGELTATLGEAARHRYRELHLLPLNSAQIRELVVARLNTRPEIAAARPEGAPEFWPVDIARIEKLSALPEGATARKVIFECDKMFRTLQGRSSEQPTYGSFLQEQFEARFAGAQRELTDARAATTSGAILSDGLPRLWHLRGCRVRREGLPRWMDHLAEPAGQRSAGIVIANDPPHSLWRKLDKIKQESVPIAQRLVILRDVLNPLTAKGSKERLRELEKSGASILSISREALAALEAMRRLLAEAESGDLALGGDSVPTATVEDWMRRQLPDTLESLAQAVFGVKESSATTNELLRDLASLVAERKIAAVSEAAKLLNRGTQEIQDCVRDNPEVFGLAGGAEPVVFERVPLEAGT
jgi:hypothetical protein